MSGSTDPELLRLLDDYGQAEYEWGMAPVMDGATSARKEAAVTGAHAALLAHVAAHYVRRDAPPEGRLAAHLDAVLADERNVAAIRSLAGARAARLHTLHYDDAGNVVSGAPDFAGDADGD